MGVVGREIGLLKCFGIRITIDYTWFIVFFLFTWTLSDQILPAHYQGFSILQYWIMGTIAAFLLFSSVLLHELAHSLMARRNGLIVRKITLFIFGGVADISKEPDTPGTELKVAIAGPFFSLILAGVFIGLQLLIYILQPPASFQQTAVMGLVIFKVLAGLNITLAVFNLIPAFPLDGGRLLRALIWIWTRNLLKATRIATNLGKGFAYFLMVTGILNLTGLSQILLPRFFQNGLIGGLWLIFIGLFLKNAAQMSYNRVLMHNLARDTLVHDLMILTISTETTFKEPDSHQE